HRGRHVRGRARGPLRPRGDEPRAPPLRRGPLRRAPPPRRGGDPRRRPHRHPGLRRHRRRARSRRRRRAVLGDHAGLDPPGGGASAGPARAHARGGGIRAAGGPSPAPAADHGPGRRAPGGMTRDRRGGRPALLTACLCVLAAACGSSATSAPPTATATATATAAPTTAAPAVSAAPPNPCALGPQAPPAGTIAANYPTALAFAPDGRLFWTERSGTVKVWQNGAAKTFAGVATVT